jgi:sulfate permease, SulP family
VLAGLDMCKTWLVGSYFKTQSKIEWMVTPVLVAAAFAVGLLSAIVLGIALSTFLFAAHFYHSGIVRFVGNGVTLRSTVERGVIEQSWLDQNATYIQILVLQHYLFFGNAQSVLNYVSTMFEEADDPNQPPVPLYLSTL